MQGFIGVELLQCVVIHSYMGHPPSYICLPLLPRQESISQSTLRQDIIRLQASCVGQEETR
jgi:hypothetical protein